MSYLLDQGLARSTVEYLRQMGIESEHVGNLGMASASDSAILEVGRKRGWVVVTLDADFHALLALSEASLPSVIRIRIEGMKGEQVATIINRVHEAAAIDLAEGAAVTVTERRIAIRRLPLSAK
jgi:predicted nuclease of predicted toxin-antitoxin system